MGLPFLSYSTSGIVTSVPMIQQRSKDVELMVINTWENTEDGYWRKTSTQFKSSRRTVVKDVDLEDQQSYAALWYSILGGKTGTLNQES